MSVAVAVLAAANAMWASPVRADTVVFQDGFESGTLSSWQSSRNVLVQSSDVRTGSFAARATAGDRAFAVAALAQPLDEIVVEVAFKLVSGGAHAVNLLRLQTPTPTNIATVFVNESRHLMLRNDVQGMNLWSSAVAAPGSWHVLRLRVAVAGPSGETEVWLDGERIDALSSTLVLGTAPVGRLMLGDNVAGRTFAVLFDDVTATTPDVEPPATACTYDPGARAVAVVVAAGEARSIQVSGSQILADGAPCGAATVTNTDRISITDPSVGGSATATLDLSGGPFAPGATDEPGASDEIEIAVNLGDGPGDRLVIAGGPGDDSLLGGTLGLNLNAHELAGVDVDLTASGVESWEILGGGGNDRLDAGGGPVVGSPLPSPAAIRGGSGSDVLVGGQAGDVVDGGEGFDTVDYSRSSGAVSVTIGDGVAGDGVPGEGDDVLGTVEAAIGGPGDDTIQGDGSAELLLGGPGGDTLIGGGGDDDLRGEDGDDSLSGGINDDQLVGGPGDDVEIGGGFNDLFIQGLQAVYPAPAAPATIPDVGTARSSFTVSGVVAGRTFDVDVRLDVEHPRTQDLSITAISPLGTRVRLIDRRGNGTPLRGTYFDSDEVTNIRFLGSRPLEGRFHPEWSMELLDGQNVNGTWTLEVVDLVAGSVGTLNSWSVIAIHGTTVSDGGDVLSGGSGDRDLVDYSGRLSPLVVTMQSGADDGQAGEADDVGAGAADIEDLYSGNADDGITGTANAARWNEIRGGAGNDVLVGLAGDDNLRAQDGNDELFGGDGTDTLQGNPGNDLLDGGPGTDWITFGAANSAVTANLTTGVATGDGADQIVAVENLIGSGSGDSLTGNGSANVLEGRSGNDTIAGLAGNDRLDGGPGTDGLDGGAGTDTCLNGESTTGCP